MRYTVSPEVATTASETQNWSADKVEREFHHFLYVFLRPALIVGVALFPRSKEIMLLLTKEFDLWAGSLLLATGETSQRFLWHLFHSTKPAIDEIDLDFIYDDAEACVYGHILTWGDFMPPAGVTVKEHRADNIGVRAGTTERASQRPIESLQTSTTIAQQAFKGVDMLARINNGVRCLIGSFAQLNLNQLNALGLSGEVWSNATELAITIGAHLASDAIRARLLERLNPPLARWKSLNRALGGKGSDPEGQMEQLEHCRSVAKEEFVREIRGEEHEGMACNIAQGLELPSGEGPSHLVLSPTKMARYVLVNDKGKIARTAYHFRLDTGIAEEIKSYAPAPPYTMAIRLLSAADWSFLITFKPLPPLVPVRLSFPADDALSDAAGSDLMKLATGDKVPKPGKKKK
ncbi:hypothetical protein Rhopal_005686-T1 [Rhodotorula paludigena]|uniref:Uncharacterized protein n=1 Tax=Rhodotorula paludigena TaxID=86838 RepID=A0AAV5GT12_9BASI|nr:hypothetical protein Rhopal_005686-T1 [Rhodotorula paludigena]